MKAMVIPRHGGPEVLQLTDIPAPQAGPGEVLIRVRACALNHLDLWTRRGIPGRQIPLPIIPGSDVAGEVAEVGGQVQGIAAGDKVVVSPGIACGRCAACAAGDDNRCREYKLLGSGLNGGCAEFIAVPAVNALPMPPGLSFEEAASVPLVFLTSWHMLVRRAQLKPGEDVLILGAGSGVGIAAMQIAKLMGARVIATAGSAAKLAKARELGADEVINHSEVLGHSKAQGGHDEAAGGESISQQVRRLTAKRGVDVVFEHVGSATFEQSVLSLATGGRLVTCGATTGFAVELDLRYLFTRELNLLGSFMGSRAELWTVLKLIGEKRLRPVVDRVYPLEQAAQAHQRMEQREQFGKIVLTV